MPVGILYGNWSGWIRLRRRSSMPSIPSSADAASTSRSSTQLDTSEPAPRNTPCWFLLVSTALTAVSHDPMSYGPVDCAIAFVLPATAKQKYAP